MPPRVSRVATASSEARETLSADGYPKETRSNSTATGPSGTRRASGFWEISGFRSRISKTRSKLTMALITSTRAPASAVSGAYSRVRRRARATTEPASRVPRSAKWPPSPYTSARASAETRVRAVMKADWAIAVRIPMSRTRAARAANSADSSAGRPNSFTSVAPGAENRSVICVPIDALSAEASRCIAAIRTPIRRAGSTNTGRSTRASRVICHEMLSITVSVSSSVTVLETTPDRVLLKARCAPITSLLRRLTSAPVRVRVKNATGIRCTWSKTAVRRSRIRPSPRVADSRRMSRPRPASATAISAMRRARRVTVPLSLPSTIAVTTRLASTGVATASRAVTTLSRRKSVSPRRCGRAKAAIRRRPARESGRRSCWALMALCSDVQAVTSMSMCRTV